MLDQLLDGAFIESVVRATIPILLAAMGGLVAERSGIFQISLEGSMVVGAFAGVAGSYWASSAFVGVVFGAIGGGLVALILAYGSVNRRAEPIVLGIAINLLALGLTGFLLAELFGVRGTFSDPQIVGLSKVQIPLLNEIPLIGDALFGMTALGYLAFASVPAIWYMLFRTPMGLRLRGVGEDPAAAITLGVNVDRYQFLAVIFSGVFAGLAGVQLSLSNVVLFAEGMSAGRSWIAVVAVMLGRAHPFGVLGVVAIFGFSEALGFRLQGNGMASQITEALPFVITLVALALSRKHFTKLLDLAVFKEPS